MRNHLTMSHARYLAIRLRVTFFSVFKQLSSEIRFEARFYHEPLPLTVECYCVNVTDSSLSQNIRVS